MVLKVGDCCSVAISPLIYLFYIQFVISISVLAVAFYLVIDNKSGDPEFSVGLSLITAVLGIWTPNPKFRKKYVDKIREKHKGTVNDNQDIENPEEENNIVGDDSNPED